MSTFMKSTNYQFWLLIMLSGLFLIRLTALIYSPLNLHGDEAQYWAWSKELDWGYFSKPPLIAWVIAATTSVLGDAEWAVRISSPILHSLTSFMIFLTGRKLFDACTGFWAAMIYALMPAVWLSSFIVSTDVSLLLCWAIALHALIVMRGDGPSWLRALQLGLAVGFGMLAKYAMMFFILAALATLVFDKGVRRALFSRYGAVSAFIAACLITPNIVWNMQHDFATLTHTAANASLEKGSLLSFIHPIEMLTFITEQFGVFGPVSFAVYLAVIGMFFRGRLSLNAKSLFLFAALPFFVISIQALLSRANANWAVTSFVAGSILAAHVGVTVWEKAQRWLKHGLIVQSVLATILMGAVLSPPLVNALGLANSVKRVRAWPETKLAIEEVYNAGHDGKSYRVIAFDNRMTFYDLSYYGLGDIAPMKMWVNRAAPHNHAELSAPLRPTPEDAAPILLVNYYDNTEARFREDFARLDALTPIKLELGGGKFRELTMWAAYGYDPINKR